MLESDILYAAIENLEKVTHSQIEIVTYQPPDGSNWDALLNIPVGRTESKFKVEVKENVLSSALLRLVEKLKEADTLLVAKYISNPAKDILEKQGINYLDSLGNCFIRNEIGISWHIRGRGEATKNGEIKHRAFQKNGIKLIYALFVNEELLNKQYREIAAVAGISASTVGDILTDLEAGKFLVKVNEKKKALVNKEELLAQWVTAFNQKLKPKLIRGKYLNLNPNWQKIKLGNQSFWGGEPAADILTNHLYPGALTLYSNLDRKSLMSEFQLIPDENNGKLTVCSLFWEVENRDYVLPALATVHPVLVYADLIGSGNDRNFETAKKIYERYIKNIID